MASQPYVVPSPAYSRTMKYLSAILVLTIMMSSCVSYRKYETALSDQDRLQTNMKLQADSLDRMTSQHREMTSKSQALGDELKLTQTQLSSLQAQYNQLEKANTDVLARYDRVLAQNQAEISSSSTELSRLRTELDKKELALTQKERDLDQLGEALDVRETALNNRIDALKTDLNSTRGVIAARESELNEKSSEINQLRNALAAKDAKINALRTKVKDALTGFSESDLSIDERGGKVYLSLSQNLLFASGSSSLNAAGTAALGQVASALNENNDIAITVEGHTDTDGDASSNWNLSTARATTVAKALIKGGIKPQAIIASGRGQFHPVATNSTTEGKAKNRRTEIILTPQLGELYELIIGSNE